MKIYNSKQIRMTDCLAINEYKIPGLELMENASNAVCDIILNSNVEKNRALIVCGKGNNGGDGFAVARILSQKIKDVRIAYFYAESDLSGDALENYRRACECKIKFLSDYNEFVSFGIECDFVVDALYGFGFHGGMNENDAKIVNAVNSFNKYIFSIDMPSGISADSGAVDGAVVKADTTVTFTGYKLSHFLFPAADYCGEIHVCDIGIPPEVINQVDAAAELTHLPKIMPREKNTHKGTYKKIWIVAGSAGMSGAAYMASEAALRSGAGLISVGVPENINSVMEVKTTEVMSVPLCAKDGHLDKSAADEIIKRGNESDALLFGPGLSLADDILKILKKVITHVNVPIIIDADGLNALSKDIDLLEGHHQPVILTPHSGEMARLTGKSISYVENNRIECALELAHKYRVCVVLKGAYTVIASPDEKVFINNTGNPGMATGGSGDVLAGIMATLVAQYGSDRYFDAAADAVCVHGAAGDIAAQKFTQTAMSATDIISCLADVWRNAGQED